MAFDVPAIYFVHCGSRVKVDGDGAKGVCDVGWDEVVTERREDSKTRYGVESGVVMNMNLWPTREPVEGENPQEARRNERT